jgi:hypothetical protein
VTTLLQWQRALQSGVLHDSPVSMPILETPAAPTAQRVAVYVHGYRARLGEVLSQDFPGLKTLLGEQDFDRLCRSYVEATPSRQYNARWYGSGLAEFIRLSSPWSGNPALAEMARFEWELGLAFDSADDSAIGAAAFQSVPASDWPTMRFQLSRSLRRCVLDWNVAAIRKAIDASDAPSLPARMPNPETRAIYRKGVAVFHRAVEPDEAAALDVVVAGGMFADVCETLCAWHPVEKVATHSLMLLKRWIEDGWIADLILSDERDQAASCAASESGR